MTCSSRASAKVDTAYVQHWRRVLWIAFATEMVVGMA